MKINKYILLLVLCVAAFTSCIKDTLYAVPEVKFTIDWSGISAAGKASGYTDSAYIYLYPDFDYKAEPIVVNKPCGEHICTLLPGKYRVLMHNAPLHNLYPSLTDDFATMAINMPNGRATSCGKLHMLPANSNMFVEVITNGNNVFKIKPVTASKNIRFVIKTERFGEITSAYGVLGGIVTKMNVNDWALSPTDISSARLPDFTIEGSTLIGGEIDVLGFNPAVNPAAEQRAIFMLYVSNTEVSYPLEQSIDLTEYLKDLKGDEIEITITVPYSPSTSAVVEIKQWLAGNELEIDIS